MSSFFYTMLTVEWNPLNVVWGTYLKDSSFLPSNLLDGVPKNLSVVDAER